MGATGENPLGFTMVKLFCFLSLPSYAKVLPIEEGAKQIWNQQLVFGPTTNFFTRHAIGQEGAVQLDQNIGLCDSRFAAIEADTTFRILCN